MHRGYVNLWRKVETSGLMEDAYTFQLFCYLMLKATHIERKQIVGSQCIELKKGELITGQFKIMADLKMTERIARSRLKLLENMGIIALKRSNKFTVVSFVNWGTYQGDNIEKVKQGRCEGQTKVKQMSNKGQTDVKQMSTNKHNKHKNNENNENNINTGTAEAVVGDFEKTIFDYTQNLELQKTLSSFVEMRKAIKKPLTSNALSLVCKKLDKLSQGNDLDKIAILENSIMNNWQGVFELKDNHSHSKAQGKTFDVNSNVFVGNHARGQPQKKCQHQEAYDRTVANAARVLKELEQEAQEEQERNNKS